MILHNAVIPGSFDPPTLGHLDVIIRASKQCENLFAVIAVNPEKKYLFSASERYKMLKQLLSEYKNIKVVIWDGLISDFCRENKAFTIFRGIRSQDDLSYEKSLERVYKMQLPQVEVRYIEASEKFREVSSTRIKNLAVSGQPIRGMVPDSIIDEIVKKVSQLT